MTSYCLRFNDETSHVGERREVAEGDSYYCAECRAESRAESARIAAKTQRVTGPTGLILTVGELIAALSTFDPSLPVGTRDPGEESTCAYVSSVYLQMSEDPETINYCKGDSPIASEYGPGWLPAMVTVCGSGRWGAPSAG